jgi:hypothetical protein
MTFLCAAKQTTWRWNVMRKARLPRSADCHGIQSTDSLHIRGAHYAEFPHGALKIKTSVVIGHSDVSTNLTITLQLLLRRHTDRVACTKSSREYSGEFWRLMQREEKTFSKAVHYSSLLLILWWWWWWCKKRKDCELGAKFIIYTIQTGSVCILFYIKS